MGNNKIEPKLDKVKKEIIILVNERVEKLTSQEKIVLILKDRGIDTSQPTVARALNELGMERDENDNWVKGAKWQLEENLKLLKEMFSNVEYCHNSPRLYTKVGVIVLRTKSNDNASLAKQIANTFKNEVLSTFCPTETEIIIYYHQKDKKSRMRVKLVELCKTIRKNNTKTNTNNNITN